MKLTNSTKAIMIVVGIVLFFILLQKPLSISIQREDILRLPQTRSNTLARFYGMDESEVETKLDEVSIEYDGSGRILKSVVAG